MSEVKRYLYDDQYPGQYSARCDLVPASAYDIAQSELAALREELAKFDQAMRALAFSLGAGGYNADKLTADQLDGKVQWGIDHLVDVHEKRLTAAEQRNATLEKAVQQSIEWFESISSADGSGHADLARAIRRMTKPTELVPAACTSCDGSGEYIDAIGDWRGYCSCPAGVALKNKPTESGASE